MWCFSLKKMCVILRPICRLSERGIRSVPAVAALVRTAPPGIAAGGQDLWVGVLVLGAGLVAERTPPERVRLAHVHPDVLQELFGRLHDGLERAGKGCEKIRRGTFKISGLQFGSGCGTGFAKCFMRVPQAVGLYWSCRAVQTSRGELSEINLQNLFHNLAPQTVHYVFYFPTNHESRQQRKTRLVDDSSSTIWRPWLSTDLSHTGQELLRMLLSSLKRGSLF